MKETKDSPSKIIDDIAKRGDGMTVPDGFFEDFAAKMSGRLPFREELDVPVAKQAPPKNNKWLRVRPYVYMAAMFAGAWCLLKMFSLMSPAENEVNLDNFPTLSKALQNDEQFVDEFILDGMSQYDFMDDEYYGIEEPDSIAQENNIETEAIEAVDEEMEAPSYILPTDGNHSSTENTSYDTKI